MRGIWGAKAGSGLKPVAGAVALAAALALSGCSSLDDAVFGGTSDAGSGVPSDPSEDARRPTIRRLRRWRQPRRPAKPERCLRSIAASRLIRQHLRRRYASSSSELSYPSSGGNLPGTMPAVADYGTPAPVAETQATPTNGVSITPVNIEPGTDTGTQVSQTVQQLRSQLSDIEQRLSSGAQRLTDLRTANGSSATTYQESKAQIMTRLQLGTTRGNPELVAQWNTAQTALDQLSANINTLNAVGTDVTTSSSSAHFILDQIVATFNVSGAVDEDHRQLAVLEDETNQTIILIDRLLKSVADDIQRQTAYVANERANLTTLANGIKNGELYSNDMAPDDGCGPADERRRLLFRRRDCRGARQRRQFPAVALFLAEPGARLASQFEFRDRGRFAHPRHLQRRADRANHHQAPRAGSVARDDRYGRARLADADFIVHRSGPVGRRSARLSALIIFTLYNSSSPGLSRAARFPPSLQKTEVRPDRAKSAIRRMTAFWRHRRTHRCTGNRCFPRPLTPARTAFECAQ